MPKMAGRRGRVPNMGDLLIYGPGIQLSRPRNEKTDREKISKPICCMAHFHKKTALHTGTPRLYAIVIEANTQEALLLSSSG